MVQCPRCKISSFLNRIRSEQFVENGFMVKVGYFKCACSTEFCTRFLDRSDIIDEEINEMRRSIDDKFRRYINGIKRKHELNADYKVKINRGAYDFVSEVSDVQKLSPRKTR